MRSIFLLTLLIFSCAARSQTMPVRTVAEAGQISDLSEEDQSSLTEMVESRNEKRLQQLLLATRTAQVLVASFDQRLDRLKDSEDLDTLMGSRLYQKLQTARGLYERVEEKLSFAAQVALLKGPQADRWFYEQLFAYGRKDVANEAAVANLLRHLETERFTLCLHCEVKEEGDLRLSFSFRDDQAFLAFKKRNSAAIAKYARITATDLLPAEGNGSSRQPKSEEYDWRNRNWIVGGQGPGEFVITYDDGPHASNTEKLMQVWESTSYPKPAFFWLTKNAVPMHSIVESAARRGFPIGLHTYRHADMGNLVKANAKANLSSVNRQAFAEELKSVSDAGFPAWREKMLDQEILGAAANLQQVVRSVLPSFNLRYFRLPYGSGVKSAGIGRRLLAANLDHFFWKVDSLDWQDKNPASIHERVITQMRAGGKGIILFHDIQPQTLEATRLLIQTFNSKNDWKPVSIRQLTQ